MQERRNSPVEKSVKCVPSLNHVHAREKQCTVSNALANQPGNCGPLAPQMNAVMRFRQALERMPRRRQHRRVSNAKYLGVERVNIDVFERRSERSLRRDAYISRDLTPFLIGKFILRRQRGARILLSGNGARLGKRRQRLDRILPLPVDVGRRHHVVVVIAIIGSRAQTIECVLRFVGVPFGQVSVRQADLNGAIVRSRKPRLVEIRFGQVEIMHGEKNIGRLKNVIWRDQSVVQTRFGKSEAELPPHIVVMTLP